jgi:hypothetical protein
MQSFNAPVPLMQQPNIINITRIQEQPVLQAPEELNYEIIKRKNPIKKILHHYFKKPTIKKTKAQIK